MLSEESEKISLENRFKETIKKANKVKEYIRERDKERGYSSEPSIAECLAYDMKYVEEYITKLQKENEILKRAFDRQTADMSNNLLELRQKDKYIKDSEDITKEMGNDINGLLLEIKEKDKQIIELNKYLERISQDLDNVAIDQIPIAIAELKYNNELKDKQIDLMAEVMFKNNTAQLIIEYGIENKEQIIKEFEKLVKEKGE